MPAYDPQAIERRWQAYWEAHKTFRAEETDSKPKIYVLDMFPYPSGDGLHVGHPLGYTATDLYCRFKRMRGFNVLHPIGYDAFGLPAEQYAIETGTHPRTTTERNIATIRRQIKQLGFSYDWDREFATTDPEYMRWTQWIFLLLYDTWFDPDYEWTDPDGTSRHGKGRPIGELVVPREVQSQGLEAARRYTDSRRLAYQAEVPVNWCPVLGTVLADEEVIDGRSERGNHPVQRLPLRQWMLRITAYADRLVEDLDTLAWPEPIKEMQRNWVGRSEGAEVDFFVARNGGDPKEERATSGFPENPPADCIRVYTTRPDTLFGATYMVLAPEHTLVEQVSNSDHQAEVQQYRRRVSTMSEEDRIVGRGEKSGVFTGGYAINPVNGEAVPIWIADYVLLTYGTGAIMAVPAHDQRDFEFAQKFGLPIRPVVLPPRDWLSGAGSSADGYIDQVGRLPEAYVGEGHGIQSANDDISLDELPTSRAKPKITEWLQRCGLGRAAIQYKLRDWLFSRQRYWGEPIPILHECDSEGKPTGMLRPIDEEQLPVLLPELEDFKPTGSPEGPLAKATDWIWVSGKEAKSDGHGQLKRETNTMPQWAGSCWYFIRFCDPANNSRPWDESREKYWMPVDLYVGGAEHAVLHLLYARFWHKVLFDRGHVSTLEPFQRLINQGMILGVTYRTPEGRVVPYGKIDFADGKAIHLDTGLPLEGETEKMSKSRGNVIPVDDPLGKYGADTVRLYEMFMGPVEATKPWDMHGVEGIRKFLNRCWRLIIDEDSDELRLHPKVNDSEPTDEQLRVTHKTTKVVSEDMEGLRFNTAISRLMEFVNFFTGQPHRPRSCVETLTLLLAPMAPHLAEELWSALGHNEPVAYAPWPVHDERYIREESVELPIQVNGRVRGRIVVSVEATPEQIERSALEDPKVQRFVGEKTIRKIIVVPKKLINIVV